MHGPVRFGSGSQRGAALIVALVLLVVMTLLGLSGMNSAVLEERMSAASYDRNLSLQAAEAALREGEAQVEAISGDNARFTAAGQNVWTQWSNASTELLAINGDAPQYRIQYLGNNFPCWDGGGSDPSNCKRYLVQGRSQPGAGRALVVLESMYGTD